MAAYVLDVYIKEYIQHCILEVQKKQISIGMKNWKGIDMTNLEKLQNGTEEEIKKLCISLAYRSGNYTYQERQVEEWLNEEVKTNCYENVIIGWMIDFIGGKRGKYYEWL